MLQEHESRSEPKFTPTTAPKIVSVLIQGAQIRYRNVFSLFVFFFFGAFKNNENNFYVFKYLNENFFFLNV